MFGKKIMVRVDNEDKIAMATAWGLVDNRPFSKVVTRKYHTVFYMTPREKESFDNIVNLYKI